MPLERNAETFLIVMEQHKGIIYKVANSYCKDEQHKQDLIQEIVLQLWLSFNRYDETFKLTTWIYRIALNVSISFYRKEHRRKVINQDMSVHVLHFREDCVEGNLKEEIDSLYVYIKSLKEIDRAIILLHLDSNNYQEISDILGLTITNVSTKLSRIRQQLKQHFKTKKLI